jgi:hypothetical protein
MEVATRPLPSQQKKKEEAQPDQQPFLFPAPNPYSGLDQPYGDDKTYDKVFPEELQERIRIFFGYGSLFGLCHRI